MTKLLLSVATALIAGTIANHAEAQCRWNGYGWACGGPAYGYAYGPASQFDDPSTYGYRPRGLPHPNGPQPGGGGCYMGQASSGCGDE